MTTILHLANYRQSPNILKTKENLLKSQDTCTHSEAWNQMDVYLFQVQEHIRLGGSAADALTALEELRANCQFRADNCISGL